MQKGDTTSVKLYSFRSIFFFSSFLTTFDYVARNEKIESKIQNFQMYLKRRWFVTQYLFPLEIKVVWSLVRYGKQPSISYATCYNIGNKGHEHLYNKTTRIRAVADKSSTWDRNKVNTIKHAANSFYVWFTIGHRSSASSFQIKWSHEYASI